MTIRALIFDVDGTLAETEEVHRAAFNRAFAEAGLDWHWDQPLYGRLLKVSGGKERLRAYARETGQAVASDLDRLVAGLHRRKTAFYTAMVAAGEVGLRPGIARLLEEARAAAVTLAIATTTTRDNVLALLAANGIDANWFATLACADDAPVKKPDPQVYRLVLDRLGLAAGECLAIEDSANGVAAAVAAGIAVIMTPSAYTGADARQGARAVWPDLATVGLVELIG
mgnify:CR=1 FL=1